MRSVLIAVITAALLVACGHVNAPDHHPVGKPVIERGLEFDCLVQPDEPGCPARIRELVQ